MMNANYFRSGFVVAALALAAGALAPPAAAQPVYKSTRPDGSVIYSDKPPAGAGRVEQVDPSRVIIEDSSARSAGGAPQAAAGSSLDKANADIAAAQSALERAQQMLKDGAEPQPGERTGTAIPGRSRLNDDYLARQKVLQDAVDAAQKRLDAAYEARKAAN